MDGLKVNMGGVVLSFPNGEEIAASRAKFADLIMPSAADLDAVAEEQRVRELTDVHTNPVPSLQIQPIDTPTSEGNHGSN